MLLKLATRNIIDKKFRSLLSIFAIVIATASLLTFLSLSNGIKTATFSELEKTSPLTQITVHPNMEKTGVISLLGQSEKGKLTKETADQLSKISGIKAIYPEIQFNNFASLEASVFGFEFVTDSMVFGVEKGFIKNVITSCHSRENGNLPCSTWQSEKEPYPAIIPKKLLDIYNFAIASPQGLPLLSENQLIGKELTLFPNYSTFFPSIGGQKDKISIEVVGFSDNVNLVGITVPYSLVEKLNQKYAPATNPTFIEIFVETVSADKIEEVAKQIEDLGYSTTYFQKNLKDVETKLNYLSITVGIISGIILLLAAIAIVGTFLSTIEEKKKELGLFRALGATKFHIKSLILIEAGTCGLIGSIIGTILGIIASSTLESVIVSKLATTTFQPENLLPITPELVIFTIVFGTILTILSAYLPAAKAANINPIETLK
ncbi:MAG: FtsX-like permease family protein [Candidatus Gracilibacteria bacterium]|jgi:ABC-type lipoprotein release transport system permease subunit